MSNAKKQAAENNESKPIPESNPGMDEFYVGEFVIIRTRSAGVWCGTILAKAGREVIVGNARRMYSWTAKKSVTLSGIALYGVCHKESRIVAPVARVWLEAIELITVEPLAQASLVTAPEVEASK
jgi:hypothetical protein